MSLFQVAIVLVVFAIIAFTTVTLCYVAPCCYWYKMRRRHCRRQIVVTSTVANMRPPPYSPNAYQGPPPSYQAVPGHESLPLPTAPPPPYMESATPDTLQLPPHQGSQCTSSQQLHTSTIWR
ncbi:protein shisa-5 isoform X2 [Fundulus heteroclitus]|uniref:protein shisa-5 isoform X2 n=1 Tax=Fundulus heteroclitus TaxID=8078 RepID=UPI00165C3724|nr:protein shisa-5 isoform X2 [Fundulus heteroclitus]